MIFIQKIISTIFQSPFLNKYEKTFITEKANEKHFMTLL